MLAIGLILIVLAGGGGAYLSWLALQNSTAVTLSGGGVSFSVLPITLIAAGVVAIVLLWIGCRLVAAGLRRRRAQRRELKELRESGAVTAPSRRVEPADRAGLSRVERRSTENDPGLRSTDKDPGVDRNVDPRT